MSRLDFDAVTETNRSRCERWHPGFPTDDASSEMNPLPWSGADWSNAVCGEAGEMANIVKKLRRLETHVRGGPGMAEVPPENDQDDLMEALADEIADVFLYLDLLAVYYDIDLPAAIVDKFNRKSEEQGFPERLELSE